MDKYLVTEKELREIVQFAQENPDSEFYVEALNDGGREEDDFLSCAFWSRDLAK